MSLDQERSRCGWLPVLFFLVVITGCGSDGEHAERAPTAPPTSIDTPTASTSARPIAASTLTPTPTATDSPTEVPTSTPTPCAPTPCPAGTFQACDTSCRCTCEGPTGTTPTAPTPSFPVTRTATVTPSPPPLALLPDLSASISIAPAPPRDCALDLGEVPRLQVTVSNRGATEAGPFSVSLNGEDVWRVESLAPGARVDLFGPFLPTGEVMVDSRNEVLESDEQDNDVPFSLPIPSLPPTCTPRPTPTPTPTEFFATCCDLSTGPTPRCGGPDGIFCSGVPGFGYSFPYRCNEETGRCEIPPTWTPTPTPTGPPALPDLAPGDVSIAPPPRGCIVNIGEVPRLRVCVRNDGEGATGPFSLSLDELTFARIDGLPPGGTLCIDGPFAPSGNIVVDAGNEVAETDESNNIRPFVLPIPTPPPTCTPTATPLPTNTA